MGLRDKAKTTPEQAPAVVVKKTSLVSNEKKLERRRRLLLRRYSGIWGAKVFWLALFTLVPLLAQLKIVGAVENPSETYIKMSVATLVYVIYHSLGIYNFISLSHFKKTPSDYGKEETASLITHCWRIDIAVRVLAPIVAILLVVTFLLYSKFHWGADRYTPPVPGFFYLVIGLVPPESSIMESVNHESEQSVDQLPFGSPTWLAIGLNELGVGPEQSGRIVEYLASTSLTESYHVPSTPWSSAFVNWVIQQDGKTGTGSARSTSWLDWGKAVPPSPGCIAIIARNDTTFAHAGFYLRDSGNDHFDLLGGNQSGRIVSIIRLPKTKMKSCRWPT